LVHPSWLRLHAGVLAGLAGLIALTIGVARVDAPSGLRATRSFRGHLGLPDCPASAEGDLRAPDALQCWFYSARGAWRLTSRVSAHHALVVTVEVSAPDDARDVARLVIERSRAGYGEVLVYVAPLEETGSVDVRRVQWSRLTGFSELTYRRPAAAAPQR